MNSGNELPLYPLFAFGWFELWYLWLVMHAVGMKYPWVVYCYFGCMWYARGSVWSLLFLNIALLSDVLNWMLGIYLFILKKGFSHLDASSIGLSCSAVGVCRFLPREYIWNAEVKYKIKWYLCIYMNVWFPNLFPKQFYMSVSFSFSPSTQFCLPYFLVHVYDRKGVCIMLEAIF